MAVVTQKWPGHTIAGINGHHSHLTHLPDRATPSPLVATTSTPFSPMPIPEQSRPKRNTVDLSREQLITVLTYFASLIPAHFHLPVRLVVHGGACMLLHPVLYDLSQQQLHLAPYSPSRSPHNSLPRRTTTRDVDYIHRSFVTEWAALGVPDAAERLRRCIRKTAKHFRLGDDWMNSDADIALPMATDSSGRQYDPVYADSIKPNNVHLHTVFTSGSLSLISVNPYWAVALKLVRYSRFDPGDICLLLRNGTTASNVYWTPETLQRWLFNECWPMGYSNYDTSQLQQMRTRIEHAVDMVSQWCPDDSQPVIPRQLQHSKPVSSIPVLQTQGQLLSPSARPPPNVVTGRATPYWADPAIQHNEIFIPPEAHRELRRPDDESWRTSPSMQMPMPVVANQPNFVSSNVRDRSVPQNHFSDEEEVDLRIDARPRRQRRHRDRPSTSHVHQAYHQSAGIEYQHPTLADTRPNAVYGSSALIPNYPSAESGLHSLSSPSSPNRGRTHTSHLPRPPDPTVFEQSVADVLAEGRLNYDSSRARLASLVAANEDSERKSREKHRSRNRKKERLAKLQTRHLEEEGGIGDDAAVPLEGVAGNRERWAEEERERERRERGGRNDHSRNVRHEWENDHLDVHGRNHSPPPALTWPSHSYAPAHTRPDTSRSHEVHGYHEYIPLHSHEYDRDERHYRSPTPHPVRKKSSSRHRSRLDNPTSPNEDRVRSRSRNRNRSRSRHRTPPEELSPLPQFQSLRIF